jgi:hypothetical protein
MAIAMKASDARVMATRLALVASGVGAAEEPVGLLIGGGGTK